MKRASSQLRTFAKAFVLATAVISVEAFATEVTHYGPYQQASLAKIVVEEFQKKTPSDDVREALLNGPVELDKAFAKEVLVRWKPVNGISHHFNQIVIKNDFGREVFRIAPVEGKPGVFIINGREWTTPSNGQISKSLRKFLQAKNGASEKKTSLFEFGFDLFGSTAEATDEAHTERAATAVSFIYSYFDGSIPKSLGRTAEEELKLRRPGDKLLPVGTGDWKLLNRLTRMKFFGGAQANPTDVQCQANSATGRILVGREPLSFTVAADQTVIFKTFTKPVKQVRAHSSTRAVGAEIFEPLKAGLISYSEASNPEDKYKAANALHPTISTICHSGFVFTEQKLTAFCSAYEEIMDPKSKTGWTAGAAVELAVKHGLLTLVESLKHQTVLFDTVMFSECKTDACDQTAPAFQNMRGFLPRTEIEEVGVAMNYRPRSNRDLGYVLDFKCNANKVQSPSCNHMGLKDEFAHKLTPDDQRDMLRITGNANSALNAESEMHQNAARSLRPLVECCQKESCRKQMLDQKVELIVPNGSGATAQ